MYCTCTWYDKHVMSVSSSDFVLVSCPMIPNVHVFPPTYIVYIDLKTLGIHGNTREYTGIQYTGILYSQRGDTCMYIPMYMYSQMYSQCIPSKGKAFFHIRRGFSLFFWKARHMKKGATYEPLGI